jgi:hypothetical protein
MMMMVSVVHRTRSLGIAAQVKMTVMVMVTVVVVVEFISHVYTSMFTHTYDVSNYM